jgi:hypothetical protein
MPLKGLDNVKRAMNVDIYNNMNDDLKGVYLSGLTNIIKETPADTGRARNNWFLSVASPSTKITRISGSANFNQLNKLPSRVINRKLYFTNNLPYIGVLEYGGYPIPGGELTEGGFSKQAPNGWVRKTLIKMANKIRSLS